MKRNFQKTSGEFKKEDQTLSNIWGTFKKMSIIQLPLSRSTKFLPS